MAVGGKRVSADGLREVYRDIGRHIDELKNGLTEKANASDLSATAVAVDDLGRRAESLDETLEEVVDSLESEQEDVARLKQLLAGKADAASVADLMTKSDVHDTDIMNHHNQIKSYAEPSEYDMLAASIDEIERKIKNIEATKADETASAEIRVAVDQLSNEKTSAEDVKRAFESRFDTRSFGLEVAMDEAERDIAGIKTDVLNIQSNLADAQESIAAKIGQPSTNPTGSAGQVLSTNGDGTTQWVDQTLPSDEQVGDAVADWLDDHPEATTTVADGSITVDKLDGDLQSAISNNTVAADNSIYADEMRLATESIESVGECIYKRVRAWQKNFPKLTQYASCFTSDDGIGFAFFTDPHNLSSETYNVSRFGFEKQLQSIGDIYNNTPAEFIVSGGDWLNTGHTLEEAIALCGCIPKLLRRFISDDCYAIAGNHDLNIEGTRGGSLTEPELANLWFGTDVGYYTVETKNCTCYLFDSGYVSTEMTAYRWGQVDWFATKLRGMSKDHAFGIIHMVKQHGEHTDLADNLTRIADAYNRKETIVLNGKSYDFSASTGTFHFMIAGHEHCDRADTLNNIPTIITKASNYGYCVDCCYADFEDSVLHMIRFGDGETRDQPIIPNNGYQINTNI